MRFVSEGLYLLILRLDKLEDVGEIGVGFGHCSRFLSMYKATSLRCTQTSTGTFDSNPETSIAE